MKACMHGRMRVLVFAVSMMLLTGTGQAATAALQCSRFAWSIDGAMQPAMAADAVSVKFADSTDTFEVTLKDWGNIGNGPGFIYSGGQLLQSGRRAALYITCGSSQTKISEGVITSVAAASSHDAPPTVTFAATGNAASLGSRGARPGRVAMVQGANLREFSSVLKQGRAEGKGLAEMTPDLRRGAVVTVSGVSGRFAGEYVVTDVIHTFDLAKGLRTEFTCTKGVAAPERSRLKR